MHKRDSVKSKSGQSYQKRDSMLSTASSFRGNKHESTLSSTSTRSRNESMISSLSSNRNKRESMISNSSSLRSWSRATPDLDHSIQEEQLPEFGYKISMNEEIIPTMSLPPQNNINAHAMVDQAEDIVNEQNKIIQELHRELAEKERQLREVQCIVDDAKSSSKRAEIARKQCQKAEEQLRQLRTENQQLKKEKVTVQEELTKSKEQYKELLHDYEVLVNEFESFSKISNEEGGEAGEESLNENTKGLLIKNLPSMKEIQELRDRCKAAEDKLKDIEKNGSSHMYPATRALLEMKEKKIQNLEKQLSEMKLNEIKLSSPTKANSLTNSPLSTLSDPATIVSSQEYQELRNQLTNVEDTKMALENRCLRLEKEVENWKTKVNQQNYGLWMPRESSRTRLTTYKYGGI